MIELHDLSIWHRAVNAIANFISEGNFRFSDDGISLKAIDPSQIVLVDFSLEKDAFERYKIEPTLAGVDLVELSKIMSRSMPNDKMLMELTDNEMQLKFEGELSRTFNLPLVDVSETEINIPKPQFDARVEINARILKEALKDASLFGSSVILRVKNNQLSVEARGSTGTLHTIAKQAKSVSIKSSAEVVSKYSLNFLQNIVKEADAEQKILLELRSDAPMKVSYNIGKGKIQFHLAHMIL